MNNFNICCIIVTYNPDERFLKNISAMMGQAGEIVVVDNKSASGLEYLDQAGHMDYTNIIFNPENYGIAKAMNIGVEYAVNKGYQWIMTLDQDSIAENDMILKMTKTYEENNFDRIGMIVPEIYDDNAKMFTHRVNGTADFEFQEAAIQSGCLYNVSIFKEIGYFNEKLFIYYVDDEYCCRLCSKGYRILRIKNAVLHHTEGNKIRRRILWKDVNYDNYNLNAVYYISRNCIYIVRNFRKKYFIRLVKDFIKILLFDDDRSSKIRIMFKGISDGLKGKWM